MPLDRRAMFALLPALSGCVTHDMLDVAYEDCWDRITVVYPRADSVDVPLDTQPVIGFESCSLPSIEAQLLLDDEVVATAVSDADNLLRIDAELQPHTLYKLQLLTNIYDETENFAAYGGGGVAAETRLFFQTSDQVAAPTPVGPTVGYELWVWDWYAKDRAGPYQLEQVFDAPFPTGENAYVEVRSDTIASKTLPMHGEWWTQSAIGRNTDHVELPDEFCAQARYVGAAGEAGAWGDEVCSPVDYPKVTACVTAPAPTAGAGLLALALALVRRRRRGV